MDQFVVCFLEAFFAHKQFLIKLFSGTETCKFNFYILSHFITGELDQIGGKIQDLHRFAHIQDKDLSPFGIGSCLEHKRHSFRNSHKIPDNIRMGNRHRPPCRDLLFKQGNNASVASQHISKPHCHKIGLGVSCKHLNDHLAHTLGGSHDIRRVYCLICRYEHKFLCPVPVRCLSSLKGSKHIIFNCLVRTVLH